LDSSPHVLAPWRTHILSCNTMFQAWYWQCDFCDAEGVNFHWRFNCYSFHTSQHVPMPRRSPIYLVWSLHQNVILPKMKTQNAMSSCPLSCKYGQLHFTYTFLTSSNAAPGRTVQIKLNAGVASTAHTTRQGLHVSCCLLRGRTWTTMHALHFGYFSTHSSISYQMRHIHDSSQGHGTQT
jgi:hypothetical protein